MIKRKLTFLLLFCLTCSLFSCDDKEDGVPERITGAWQLISIHVDNQEQDISGKDEIILFAETAVFKRYLSDEDKYRIGGWSMTSDVLNISLDLPAAYYIEALNSTDLSLKRLDFNNDGNLKTTLYRYRKVSEELLP